MRTLFLFLLSAQLAGAANVYVRVGASGARNGADWTDAYTNLPSALVRGDVYYIADTDGSLSLPAYTFDDAVSGTNLITIKKATVADHGTSTGWSDSYGDGRALWVANGVFVWYFPSSSSGYYNFDGVTGGGPAAWTNGHGFKLDATGGGEIIYGGYSNRNHNVTFAHIEMTCGTNAGPPYATGLYWPTFASNTVIRYCYIHHIPGDLAQIRGLVNFTEEYNFVGDNFQDGTRHGDLWESDGASTNHIHRWGIVRNPVGTYFMGHHGDGQFTTMTIYGMVFFWDTNFVGYSGGNGSIGATISSATHKLLGSAYNNTFVNIFNGGPGNASVNPFFTGSQFNLANNLFHFKPGDTNTTTFQIGTNVTAFDDWYFNRTNSYGFQSSGDPFVNWQGLDFRLVTNSPAVSGTPYGADWNGTLYNASGTWTIGALAFTNSTAAAAVRPPMLGVPARFRP